jgi:hypothetical protein
MQILNRNTPDNKTGEGRKWEKWAKDEMRGMLH